MSENFLRPRADATRDGVPSVEFQPRPGWANCPPELPLLTTYGVPNSPGKCAPKTTERDASSSHNQQCLDRERASNLLSETLVRAGANVLEYNQLAKIAKAPAGFSIQLFNTATVTKSAALAAERRITAATMTGAFLTNTAMDYSLFPKSNPSPRTYGGDILLPLVTISISEFRWQHKFLTIAGGHLGLKIWDAFEGK